MIQITQNPTDAFAVLFGFQGPFVADELTKVVFGHFGCSWTGAGISCRGKERETTNADCVIDLALTAFGRQLLVRYRGAGTLEPIERSELNETVASRAAKPSLPDPPLRYF